MGLRALPILVTAVWSLLPGAPARAQLVEEGELPLETVEEPEEVTAPDLAEQPGEAPPELPGAVEGPRPEEGPVVARVEVRSDAPLEEPDEIRELVAVRPGERLTERTVRRTLRNIQATGIAYEVELYTRPAAADAVDVVLVLRQAVHVTDVAIEGDLGRVDRIDVERELTVAPRQPLIESRLLRGVYRVQELFEHQGYFDATVRLEVDVDEASKRARIVYRIEAGPRALIGGLRFEGDLGPFTPQQLQERVRLRFGDPYRQEPVRDSAVRLQEWLVNQEYRTAEVEEPEEHLADDALEIDLVYAVEVGPRVEVEIVGAPRKELVRNDLLPFLGDEGYDEALVLQAVDRVTGYYQEQGHWQVEVGFEEELREGVLHVAVVEHVEAVQPRRAGQLRDERERPAPARLARVVV
ncbi:MAG TPA: POTRA domain-containing protein, partial [Thermoanaerobaculia bacterium]